MDSQKIFLVIAAVVVMGLGAFLIFRKKREDEQNGATTMVKDGIGTSSMGNVAPFGVPCVHVPASFAKASKKFDSAKDTDWNVLCGKAVKDSWFGLKCSETDVGVFMYTFFKAIGVHPSRAAVDYFKPQIIEFVNAQMDGNEIYHYNMDDDQIGSLRC